MSPEHQLEEKIERALSPSSHIAELGSSHHDALLGDLLARFDARQRKGAASRARVLRRSGPARVAAVAAVATVATTAALLLTLSCVPARYGVPIGHRMVFSWASGGPGLPAARELRSLVEARVPAAPVRVWALSDRTGATTLYVDVLGEVADWAAVVHDVTMRLPGQQSAPAEVLPLNVQVRGTLFDRVGHALRFVPVIRDVERARGAYLSETRE